jgi:hypothetical protein
MISTWYWLSFLELACRNPRNVDSRGTTVKPHGTHFLLFTGLLLSAATVSSRARAEQFVLIDLTYEATSANTTDSHFPGPPAANIPKNLKSPIDYASGTAYVRFEVLSKPSAAKTLYNICFQNPSNYACLGYPPAYTATGTYNFSGAFSSFWQGDLVDWSMGISEVQLILKDEKEVKVQGNAMFYPYKMHVTITIVAPGSTYVPPDMAAAGAGGSSAGGSGGAAGMSARGGTGGSRAGAGGAGAGAAGAVAGSDAVGSGEAGRGAAGAPESSAGSGSEGEAGAPATTPDAGSAEGSDEGDTAGSSGGIGRLPQGVAKQPNKRAPPPGNIEAGCSTVVPRGRGGDARKLAALSCLVALVGAERTRRRRRLKRVVTLR